MGSEYNKTSEVAMINGLGHDDSGENECDVCSTDFTDDEGGITGYFGILPVAFCPDCLSSMCDMVSQLMGWGEEEDE